MFLSVCFESNALHKHESTWKLLRLGINTTHNVVNIWTTWKVYISKVLCKQNSTLSSQVSFIVLTWCQQFLSLFWLYVTGHISIQDKHATFRFGSTKQIKMRYAVQHCVETCNKYSISNLRVRSRTTDIHCFALLIWLANKLSK